MENINAKYLVAAGSLAKKLDEANVPYEVQAVYTGFMFVFPNQAARKGDVILHNGSYGNSGLMWEAYQGMTNGEIGDIEVIEEAEVVRRAIELTKEEN